MSTFNGFVQGGRFEFDFPAAYRAYIRRLEGEEVTVEIRKKRSKRSDRLNRAFWAALTPWAHELGYEPVDLKDELMALLWGYHEVVSPLTGEVRIVANKSRSSQLTNAEMCQLYEFMAVKAAETGYVMELADEFNARKAAEAKRGRSKAA